MVVDSTYDDNKESPMKASDIKTDGTEYAYSEKEWLSPRRVKIVGRGTIKGHWRSRGPAKRDQPGWVVEFLDHSPDPYGPKQGDECVVTSRQIRSTWANKGDS
jgi:hypothetical protein